MKTMLIAVGLDNDVTLIDCGALGYEVTYGQQLVVCTTFEEALEEYVKCVKHSATCASLMERDDL